MLHICDEIKGVTPLLSHIFVKPITSFEVDFQSQAAAKVGSV